MLQRITVFLAGLMAIYLLVPVPFALADVEATRWVGIIRVVLLALWIVAFILYIAAQYRGRYKGDQEA